MKTKMVLSQRVESDATPRCPVGSVSSEISSVMTPGGDRVLAIEYVKKLVQLQLEEPKEIRESGL